MIITVSIDYDDFPYEPEDEFPVEHNPTPIDEAPSPVPVEWDDEEE